MPRFDTPQEPIAIKGFSKIVGKSSNFLVTKLIIKVPALQQLFETLKKVWLESGKNINIFSY